MKTEDIVGENAFEAYKCVLDYLKHITTVCSAVSLVGIALYKDIVVSDFQFILIASIGLFIAAAGASIITHLVFLLPNFETKWGQILTSDIKLMWQPYKRLLKCW